MTDPDQHEAIQIFVGIDVNNCNGAHPSVSLNRVGKRLIDTASPNDEW